MALLAIIPSLPWQRLRAPLFFAAAIFYLIFHAISGERGLYALIREQHRLDVLQTELDLVNSQNEALESKVSRMRSSSLDLDLLDEQAREVLGYADKNEVIIVTTPK